MIEVKNCNIKKISNKIFSFSHQNKGSSQIPRDLWDEMIEGIRCMEQAINGLQDKKIIEINGLNSKEITFKLFLEETHPTKKHECVLLIRLLRFLPSFYGFIKYDERRDEWEDANGENDVSFTQIKYEPNK